MLTRINLQKKIICTLMMLSKNALKCSYVCSKYGNSYSLELIFTFKENKENFVIIKSDMPEVYDYFYKLIGISSYVD